MSSDNEPDKVPVLNIANALTVLRLILVPVFVAVYWADTPGRAWAAGIFALAALTICSTVTLRAAGGLITDFGKLADSIADKFLIGAALIMPAPWPPMVVGDHFMTICELPLP